MHDAPNRELLLALLGALARIEELNARCAELEANINIARVFNAPPQPVSPRRFLAAGLREGLP